MDQGRTFAYRVTFHSGGRTEQLVVAAADLAGAAGAVHDRLDEAHRVLEIRSLAEVMPVLASPAPVQASPAPVPEPRRPTLARRRGGTRQSQLLSVLEEVGGPVHLDDIADALGINRAYADNVALRALRAGLVTRDGVGTGRVQLAGEGAPCQPVVRRRAGRGARPTRLELLLELLQGRDEPVHISEVAGTLGLTRTHADNVVAYGVNYGLVSRTGDRTGRIVLAGMQPAAT